MAKRKTAELKPRNASPDKPKVRKTRKKTTKKTKKKSTRKTKKPKKDKRVKYTEEERIKMDILKHCPTAKFVDEVPSNRKKFFIVNETNNNSHRDAGKLVEKGEIVFSHWADDEYFYRWTSR